MYILVSVCERDIGIPTKHKTFELAQRAMFEEIAPIFGTPADEIAELAKDLSQYDEVDGDNGITLTKDGAYGERYHNNYDWKIFKI